MSGASLGMMILLMLIGGSPGSTAGGMKTTTLAVLLANAAATFRQRDSAQFFGRRVGGLTFIYAAVSGKKIGNAKLPQERITIG